MTALAVARATVLRALRDRTALFFMVLLPVAIIVVIGITVNGFDRFRVGIVPAPRQGPVARELVADLRSGTGLRTRVFRSAEDARNALRRAELDAVVVMPADLDEDVRSGRSVTVPVLVEPSGNAGHSAVSTVSAVVAGHAAKLQAARFAAQEAGGTFETDLDLARGAERAWSPIAVRTETVDGVSEFLPLGYSYSTPTMLVLFVFVNALAGGAAIVQTRRTGVYTRVLAAPVPSRALVLGETAAYLLLALVQSVLIVGIGALAFGVSWGDPLAAAALVAVWALVGTGAGVLAGALFRTPEQVHALGPALGITLGMLGGCMWPLALVPGWLRTAGHAAPHAWAVDAWTELLSRGGGPGAILTDLLVLLGFAVALLTAASLALRHRLTTTDRT
ncbi:MULTISPECIES: ABC transporter permease [unclassified Streptomyces]|uniref:ABC transporter permease n=1 Tax=unclassified Streptomyces TaxID=2593676 RepID=UPI001F03D88C|nr:MULTISPECIES: ABC transporter permease [unclassified Streptomyces]MCH0565726.1 ABC transporter permease [Streptomyces sp. MUM 2J]MCH0570593.1 ABC transporter permease [Streptomyces sp. MUM 136J]